MAVEMKYVCMFLLYVAVFVTTVGFAAAEPVEVIAVGKILCHGQPLKHSKVSLMDKDLDRDQFMGSSTTDEFGKFQIFGSGSDRRLSGIARRPDVYIRVDYKHASQQADFEVNRALVRGGKEESRVFADRSYVVDFETLRFDTEMCRVYQRFYDATHDFYRRVGYKVPFELKITAEAILNGGTPFTLYDSIRIPRGKRLSSMTAKHELAHAVRHKYDGSRAHFLRDVARFRYMRNHLCSLDSNLGFAFNEGWAEYWEGHTSCGRASGTKTVEGNVAAALKRLQDTCGTSDHDMWEVLRRNPGSIHAYLEFESKHNSTFGCSH